MTKGHQICVPNKEMKLLYTTLAPFSYDLYKNANQKRYLETHPLKFRLSNSERAAKMLPQNLKDILVGLLLGDLFMGKRTKNSNPVLQFDEPKGVHQ